MKRFAGPVTVVEIPLTKEHAMTAQPVDLRLPESAEALQTAQDERRRTAFERAKTAPFFKARLGHLDAERICRPEEWAKIPILDKEQLRALSPDTFYNDFCLGGRTAVSEYWRSGGSTGRPLFYPRTREDVHYGLLGFMRILTLAGLSPEDVCHMALPLGIHPAGHLMARAVEKIGAGAVWAGGGNTLPSMAQLDLIRLFRPTSWIGMASYGIQLANLAKSEGFDLSAAGIGKVVCTAEPLSASKRSKLAALWNAEVRDCYGMTEMMMLGGEDGARDGFRFWSDFCYPEVVDPDSHEPVAAGEPGVLIVTSLTTNNATPFIRWNSGDIVTLRPAEPGAGGFGLFPLVTHTHRTAGFVKVRGVNIGFTDLEDLMFNQSEVSDFRVEVTGEDGRDELDLHVELAPGSGEAGASAAVTAAVQRVFGLSPRIVPTEAGAIARAFEGSFKPARFLDLRS